MIDPTITLDMQDPKKTLDEISLARFRIMAEGSLSPDEFEMFVIVHNVMIDRRRLQNEKIEELFYSWQRANLNSTGGENGTG